MDGRVKKLVEELRTLVKGEFSGFIKINFSQGSLGRVEKSEDFEDLARHDCHRESGVTSKSDDQDVRDANL